MHPQRTNPDPGYFPVSERMAGWILGLVILGDLMIVAGVGLMFMWAAGVFG